jgi:hypothetical protein
MLHEQPTHIQQVAGWTPNGRPLGRPVVLESDLVSASVQQPSTGRMHKTNNTRAPAPHLAVAHHPDRSECCSTPTAKPPIRISCIHMQSDEHSEEAGTAQSELIVLHSLTMSSLPSSASLAQPTGAELACLSLLGPLDVAYVLGLT